MTNPGIHGEESPDFDEPTLDLSEITGELPLPVTAVPDPPVLHSPGVRRLLFAGLAVALLVAGGLAVGSLSSTAPRPAPPRAAAPPQEASPESPASPANRGFDLVSGAAAVTVRTADLGADLYRIDEPARAVDEGGRLRLAVPGTDPVELTLSDRVGWDLTVGGGADRRRVDLAGGRFRGVSLRDSANDVELVLPRPDGTLSVTLAGGANRIAVRTAGPEPVRVRVGSGAGQVVLSGETHSGVAAGALFTPDRWAAAGDRIDLDATAGMSLLTLS